MQDARNALHMSDDAEDDAEDDDEHDEGDNEDENDDEHDEGDDEDEGTKKNLATALVAVASTARHALEYVPITKIRFLLAPIPDKGEKHFGWYIHNVVIKGKEADGPVNLWKRSEVIHLYCKSMLPAHEHYLCTDRRARRSVMLSRISYTTYVRIGVHADR
jgi:hypothetical protein